MLQPRIDLRTALQTVVASANLPYHAATLAVGRVPAPSPGTVEDAPSSTTTTDGSAATPASTTATEGAAATPANTTTAEVTPTTEEDGNRIDDTNSVQYDDEDSTSYRCPPHQQENGVAV
jgi:hypothetical protein